MSMQSDLLRRFLMWTNEVGLTDIMDVSGIVGEFMLEESKRAMAEHSKGGIPWN